MGDVQEGETEAALQILQLDLHLLAHLAVERRKRFVEQQQARLIDDGAGERDALLLSAGQLARPARAHGLHAHHAQRLIDLLRDVRFGQALEAEAEGDVLGDIEVREERVALENGVDRALACRHVSRSVPSSSMMPSEIVSKPPIILRMVVLPQPDGPSRVT